MKGSEVNITYRRHFRLPQEFTFLLDVYISKINQGQSVHFQKLITNQGVVDVQRGKMLCLLFFKLPSSFKDTKVKDIIDSCDS